MISGVITVLLLLLFIAGWFWVWRPERAEEFDAAAQLPLQENAGDAP